MLKTKAPKFNTASAVNKNPAATHLWEDFVKQVAGYARRVNVAYKDVPQEKRFSSRTGQQNLAVDAWYNKNPQLNI